VAIGAGGMPYIATHDGRTIHYPDPVNDTVKYDLDQAKLVDFVEFDMGNICIIGGRIMVRAGVIIHCEKHIGGFDIVRRICSTVLLLPGVSSFLSVLFLSLSACRITNIFVIGEGNNPWISLPKCKGTTLTISEERDLKRKRAAEQ
ncbi:hypothetical protein K438DRAFT_1642149, partial [Mycena galopus ATCC 62051]